MTRFTPDAPALLLLGAYFAAGIAAGALYFRVLRWTSDRLVRGGGAGTAIGATVARLALLGGLLTLASLEGAMPLLTMAIGVFVARFAVMRGVRTVPP